MLKRAVNAASKWQGVTVARVNPHSAQVFDEVSQ